MRFIELSNGFSVCVDEIEAVERGMAMTSIVHTHHNTYNSTFPYETLLELLEKITEEKPKEDNRLLNIAKEVGTFAG